MSKLISLKDLWAMGRILTEDNDPLDLVDRLSFAKEGDNYSVSPTDVSFTLSGCYLFPDINLTNFVSKPGACNLTHDNFSKIIMEGCHMIKLSHEGKVLGRPYTVCEYPMNVWKGKLDERSREAKALGEKYK